MKIRWLILIALSFLILPDDAFSAQCDAAGNPVDFTSTTYHVGITGHANPADCKVGLTNLVSGTICVVQSIFAQNMFRIYCRIFINWGPIINKAILLYIMFYGIALLFGLVDAKLRDAFFRMVKVVLIYQFAQNADLFYFYIYEFFLDFMNWFSLILMGVNPVSACGAGEKICPGTSVFDYLDRIFEMSVGTGKLILLIIIAVAFLFLGPTAFISMMIFMGIIEMLKAFFWIVNSMLIAMITITFLSMFAPIFISFMLFERTKQFFTSWMGSMISFTLQPIVIMAFVFVIGQATSLETLLGGIVSSITMNSSNLEPNNTQSLGSEAGMDWIKVDSYMPFPATGPACTTPRCVTPGNPAGCTPTGDPPNCMKAVDTDYGAPGSAGLLDVFIRVIGFVLGWYFLNVMASSFLKRLPDLSRQLSKWKNVPAAQITGSSMRISDYFTSAYDPRNPRPSSAVGGRSEFVGPGSLGGGVFNIVDSVVRRGAYLATGANPQAGGALGALSKRGLLGAAYSFGVEGGLAEYWNKKREAEKNQRNTKRSTEKTSIGVAYGEGGTEQTGKEPVRRTTPIGVTYVMPQSDDKKTQDKDAAKQEEDKKKKKPVKEGAGTVLTIADIEKLYLDRTTAVIKDAEDLKAKQAEELKKTGEKAATDAAAATTAEEAAKAASAKPSEPVKKDEASEEQKKHLRTLGDLTRQLQAGAKLPANTLSDIERKSYEIKFLADSSTAEGRAIIAEAEKVIKLVEQKRKEL